MFGIYLDQTHFVHVNALGSTSMTSSAAGVVDGDMVDYPWGQSWLGTAPEWHYAAFEYGDSESGLYPTPNRQYTTGQGRWLTPDPGGVNVVRLDDPQTWNMYAYVTNNPTTLTDPTGLHDQDDPCAANSHGAGSSCNSQNDPNVMEKRAERARQWHDDIDNQFSEEPDVPAIVPTGCPPGAVCSGVTEALKGVAQEVVDDVVKPLVDSAAGVLDTALAGFAEAIAAPLLILTSPGNLNPVDDLARINASRRSGQRKGERHQTAKPDKPAKHAKPVPNKPGRWQVQDPHTGKWSEKPPGWSPDSK